MVNWERGGIMKKDIEDETEERDEREIATEIEIETAELGGGEGDDVGKSAPKVAVGADMLIDGSFESAKVGHYLES